MNSTNRPQRSGGSRRRERTAAVRPSGENARGGESARRISQRRKARRDAVASAATQARPVSWLGRLRSFAMTVGLPLLVVVLGLVVVVFAFLLLASRPLSLMPASIASLWLVINLSPVTIGGVTVGVAPMLPAAGLIWLLSQRIYKAVRDRVSLADLAVLAALALGIPIALTLIAMGMLIDASAVYPVAAPPIAPALAKTLLVHLIALVIGMRARLWKALARNFAAPEWLVDAAGSAARFIAYFSAASLAVWLLFALAGWDRQAEVFADYASGGGPAAIVALTLLYLPNAAVATASVLVGSEFHIGEASVSLFSIHLVPLPPLPLFAAIPGQAQWWGILLMAIPALIAAALSYPSAPSFRGAAGTGVFGGLFALVVGYLAGGQLGVYGATGPLLALFALLTVLWLGGVGMLTAAVGRFVARRREAAAGAAAAPQEEPEAPEAPEAPEVPAEDVADPAGAEVAGEVVATEEEEVETEEAEAAEPAEEAKEAEAAEGEEAAEDTAAPVPAEEEGDGGVDKHPLQ